MARVSNGLASIIYVTFGRTGGHGQDGWGAGSAGAHAGLCLLGPPAGMWRRVHQSSGPALSLGHLGSIDMGQCAQGASWANTQHRRSCNRCVGIPTRGVPQKKDCPVGLWASKLWPVPLGLKLRFIYLYVRTPGKNKKNVENGGLSPSWAQGANTQHRGSYNRCVGITTQGAPQKKITQSGSGLCHLD